MRKKIMAPVFAAGLLVALAVPLFGSAPAQASEFVIASDLRPIDSSLPCQALPGLEKVVEATLGTPNSFEIVDDSQCPTVSPTRGR